MSQCFFYSNKYQYMIEVTLSSRFRDLICISVFELQLDREKHRCGRKLAQTTIASAFLSTYSEHNGKLCPLGRGTSEKEPLRVLPSSEICTSVYSSYKNEWSNLCHGAQEEGLLTNILESEISFSQYRRVWREKFSTLRIAQRRTDFCDHCVVMLNRINQVGDDEIGARTEELLSHKQIAQTEYES